MPSLADPFLLVFFRSGVRRYPVNHATVRESLGAHDVAKLEMRGAGFPSVTSGTPVILQWTARGGSRRLLGYVHQPGDKGTASSNTRTLTLVGASWVLKDRMTRPLRMVTGAGALSEVARSQALLAWSDPTPEVHETLALPFASQWEFLRMVAERSGLLLRADGLVVRLLDPDRHEKRVGSRAPVFVGHTQTPARVEFSENRSSTPASAHSFVDRETYSVETVGDFSPGLVDRQETFMHTVPSHPVGSVREAARALHSARSADRWRYFATVTSAPGETGVRVGGPVVLSGFSGKPTASWTVLEATHRVSGTSAETEFRAARAFQPGTESIAQRPGRFPADYVFEPREALVSGRWRAT